MLINLSNHPSALWDADQMNTAVGRFGKVVDIPFPAVSPEADLPEVVNLARDFFDKIISILSKESDKNNAVHLMGEFAFTYTLANFLRVVKIKTILSTTKREKWVDENGNDVSRFRFIRFRDYF